MSPAERSPTPPVGPGERSVPEFTIRPAGDNDLSGVLALLRSSMGEDSRAGKPDYWRWKHVDNPFGASPCLVADADGEIVGVRVFMRWRWQTGERSVEAVRAVDTATHSNFRRRGVFSGLTRALLASCGDEGISFVFNTPNSRSRPGYLKMGWTTVTRVPLMLRPMRPIRILASVWKRRGSSGSRRLTADGFPSAEDFLRSTTAEVVLTGGPGVEQRYHTPLSRAYLSWRYVSVPYAHYHAIWQDSDPTAALIFATKERSGLRELLITEVLVGAGAAGMHQAARLLRRLCGDLECDYAVATAPRGSRQRGSLVRARFLPTRGIGPHLCVRPLRAQPPHPDPTRWASWSCSAGDLELF